MYPSVVLFIYRLINRYSEACVRQYSGLSVLADWHRKGTPFVVFLDSPPPLSPFELTSSTKTNLGRVIFLTETDNTKLHPHK